MKKYNNSFIAVFIVYILICLGLFLYEFFLKKHITIPACPFYTLFGLYCPACGGTRATLALLHFDILSSICFNPVPLYVFLSSTIYLIVELINIIFNKKIKFPILFVVYFGLFIFIVNWIIQNIIILSNK